MTQPRNFRLSNAFSRFACRLFVLAVCGMASPLAAQTRPISRPSISIRPLSFAIGSPLIRVGLMRWTNAKRLTLQSPGGARLIGPDGSERGAGVGMWTFTRSGNGYLISDAQGHTLGALTSGDGNAVWRLQCDRPDALACLGAGTGIGQRYRGSVEIGISAGHLRVVNEVALESYLCGVVVQEMGRAPVEALKAQAVAARTFAVHSLNRWAAEGYDVRDTVESQVYGGADGETPEGNSAVAATSGLILMRDERPISAQFCADCGGITAPGSPNDCPGCAEDADAHGPADHPSPPVWTFTVPAPRLLSLLKPTLKPLPAAPPSPALPDAEDNGFGLPFAVPFTKQDDKIKNDAPGAVLETLEVLETDASGRVRKLRYAWRPAAKGKEAKSPLQTGEVGGNTLRNLLGLNTLRSVLFTVKKDADGAFVFTGRGWGHGHGLCQTGAIALAGEPFHYDFHAILTRYYAGATLGQLAYLEPENERQEEATEPFRQEANRDR